MTVRSTRDTTPWAVGRGLIDAQVAAHELLAPEYVSNNPDICRQPMTNWGLAEQVWNVTDKVVNSDGSLGDMRANFAW